VTTEYKLPREHYGKLLQQSIIRGAAYWLAAASVARWYIVAEPDTWHESKQQITIVLFAVVLGGIYTAVFNYYRGKSATLILDTEKIVFRSMHGLTDIAFSDIQRIARTRQNVLLIYLHPFPRKAVLAISDKLENFSEFEKHLGQHVKIVNEPRLPRAFNLYFIAALNFFVMLLLLHHFMSHNNNNVITTGIVLLLLYGYYLRRAWMLRNYRKYNRTLIVSGILAALIIIRIALHLIPMQ
jgi:hypothetical protein